MATALTAGLERCLLHGVPIELLTSDDAVRRSLLARLGNCPAAAAQDGGGLAFEVRSVDSPRDHAPLPDPRRARRVHESPIGSVFYVPGEDLLFIDCGDLARAVVRAGRGEATITLLAGDGRALWLASRPLFTVALLELMSRRGLPSVHASAVAADGRAVLIAGASGTGKSTLCVALLRAGFGFMGDDTVFLRDGDQGLRVLGLPEVIGVRPETSALLPAAALAAGVRIDGWPKLEVPAQALGSGPPAWEGRPALVVFPSRSGRRRSRLLPVTVDEAMAELVPNVMLTESRAARRHLAALAELARTARSYRLEAAADFGRQTELIGRALAEVA